MQTTTILDPFDKLSDEYLNAYDACRGDADEIGEDAVMAPLNEFADKYNLDKKRNVLAALLRAVRDGEVMVFDNPGNQDRHN